MSVSKKEQANNLRNQITAKKRLQLKEPTASPMHWKGDGVDHYNIWEIAETELGKFLMHSSLNGFRHKLFGKFVSIESFWNYIQSEERDDQIRVMHGPILRTFIRKLNMRRVKNFRAIIMDANWQKIRQNKEMMTMMAESTLPFDCYFINTKIGVRTRPSFFKWVVMGFDEIRQALKEGREPVFDFLLDVPDSDIYQFALTSTEVKGPKILSDQEARLILEKLSEEST